MKAKIYNTSNCAQRTATGTCYVTVSRPLRRVSFSPEAVRRLGISEESYINFVQDTERPRDWYIETIGDENSFRPIVWQHKNGPAVKIVSAGLVDAICQSLGFTGKSFNVNIGKLDENNLWPLITAAVR